MPRVRERDEYQVGSLINGLPTCTFPPKTYSRVITNIVVTNSVTSQVFCYRGTLGGSVPVAQNLLGINNTLKGEIVIPAGQAFWVQWSAVGTSPQLATARVSWEREANPFEAEAGFNTGQEWATQAVTSLQVPTGTPLNEPSIVIGSDLPLCMQATYTAAIFFRPRFSQAPDSAPIFFMAQRKQPVGANYINVVDHGWVIDNGVMCGYIVQRRVAASNQNGLGTNFVMTDKWAPNIDVNNITLQSNQVQFDGVTDIFLLSSTNTRFFAYGDQLSLRMDTAWGNSINGSSTASGSFANYPWTPVPALPSIAKIGSAGNTEIEVTMHVTSFVDAAATGPEFAVNINGTDYVTCRHAGTNPVTQRFQASGVVRTTGGTLAAGTYSITPRWRRVSGANNCQSNVDDYCSISAREVPA